VKALVGLLLLVCGLVVVLPALGVVLVVGVFDLASGGAGQVVTVSAPARGSTGSIDRPATQPLPVSNIAQPLTVSPDQWALMVAAAQASACGVTAQDLAAIAKTESGFGANMATSSTGAIGYGQFLPATWSAYGQGDPYDFHAAIPTIARYLCAIGYGQDRAKALNAYGGCTTPRCLGSTDYAGQIDRLASQFGVPATAAVSAAVATALQWIGTPYVWGGNTPGVGLDCSGLVQQALAAIGVRVPRTSEQQYAASQRISADQVQPGDLAFFSSDGPGATHVGLIVAPGEMVDAPQPGEQVRTESYLTPYWRSVLFGFGRLG
jgi:cell wall-associated NlpC family hydrolase